MSGLRWNIAQWFERRWWRNYLGNKQPEEYLNWKRNYWSQFLKDINLVNVQGAVLDIGCGPAGIFTVLQDNMTALDPLLNKYEADLPIFSQEKYPQVQFICKPFEAFEQKEEFQTIFCLNAINHFENLELSMQKIKRLTADNGQLVLSIDAHNYGLFKFLFRLLPLDILHPYQFDLNEYKAMVLDLGFEIESVTLKKAEFFFDYYILVARKAS